MLSSHSLPTATPPWSTAGTQPEQRGAARQALSKSLLSTPQVLGPRGAAFQCFTSGRCSHGAQKQSLSADMGEQGTMLRCPGPLSCYPRLTLVALSYTCLPDGTRKPWWAVPPPEAPASECRCATVQLTCKRTTTSPRQVAGFLCQRCPAWFLLLRCKMSQSMT